MNVSERIFFASFFLLWGAMMIIFGYLMGHYDLGLNDRFFSPFGSKSSAKEFREKVQKTISWILLIIGSLAAIISIIVLICSIMFIN